MADGREVTNLLNRAGLWEKRTKEAALKGDYDRAGRLRNEGITTSGTEQKSSLMK